MKRSLGLVAALVLSTSLATVAAGSAEAQTTKVLSKTELRDALLTANDLPKGFKVDRSSWLSDDSDDDGTTFTGDPACATWFRMTDPVLNDPTAPNATRAFSHRIEMETIETGAQSFSGTAPAAQYFADLTSTIGSCHHAAAHDPKDSTTMRYAVTYHRFVLDGHRAFVATVHARYGRLSANLAITAAQVRNNIVAIDASTFRRRAAAEARLAKSLLRAQSAKLTQHLR